MGINKKTLMNKLENLAQRYHGIQLRIQMLETDYLDKKKGRVYITRKLQLDKEKKDFIAKLLRLGGGELVKLTYTLHEEIKGVPWNSRYHIFFTGLTAEEAQMALMFREPKALNIKAEHLLTGVPSKEK